MSGESERSIVVRNVAIGLTIAVVIIALVFYWNRSQDLFDAEQNWSVEDTYEKRKSFADEGE